LQRAGALQVDRLTEHPDCVPMQFAAQVAQQLLGTAELLDGRATVRVEQTEKVDMSVEAYEAFIASQMKVANAREVTPEMGLEAGKFPANSDGPLAIGGRGAASGVDPHHEDNTDVESDGQEPSSKENRGDVAACVSPAVAEGGELALDVETPRGGDRSAGQGGNGSTYNHDQKFLVDRGS
jgi:hypothetical protein